MQKKYHLTHANVGLIAAIYASVLSLALILIVYFEPSLREVGLLGLFIWIPFIFLPYICAKFCYLGHLFHDFLWKKRNAIDTDITK